MTSQLSSSREYTLCLFYQPRNLFSMYLTLRFLQHYAISFEYFIPQRGVSNVSLAAQVRYCRSFIKAAFKFRKNSNYLTTTQLLFEKTKLPLIESATATTSLGL